MGRDYDKLVEESLEVAEQCLSEWEVMFLESVKERLEGGGDLTDNQKGKIWEIYQKVCESPY